jgi:peptide chain release factor subunit 1
MPPSVGKTLGMAGMVTAERLRELAAFRVEQGCAISLYVGFEPSTSSTIPAAHVKINSLVDEAQKSAFATRGELTHDQKLGLQADFDRIRTFLSEELDRSGVRGVAIFSAGLDNFWSVSPLSETVPDDARVGTEFYVAPLVPLVGRGNGAIVAVVDRERGLLFILRSGRLEPLADLTEEQPGRHDQGGWSQARFQRRIDELTRDHLRAVADDLDKQLRSGVARHVVVIGPEEARSEFDGLLSQEATSAVVGMTSGEGYASPGELLELAQPFIEEARLAEETEILERWQSEAGRNGRAAVGWEETLESASDGRVETLLFQQGIQRRAYQCPQCGRAQAADGACPLDGTQMEARDDGVDVAVHQTLAHGGNVHSLPRERLELEPAEGIAALLRF